MDTGTGRMLHWALIAGLSICLVALALQYSRIDDLAEDHAALVSRLTAELETVEAELADREASIRESRVELAALRNSFRQLSGALAQLAETGVAELDPALIGPISDPNLLAPGIYVLPGDEAGANEQDAYTIYHVAAIVSAGEYEQKLQFGIGRSGVIGWRLYFDYDNDGRVDMDMLREFIDSVPFGGYVSGSLDSESSQAIYDRLLHNSDDADYTPPDQIDERSGEIAQQMWSYVARMSEQLASWTLDSIRNEAPAERQDESTR